MTHPTAKGELRFFFKSLHWFIYDFLQFRALSDQFYRTPEHHKFVRQQVVRQVVYIFIVFWYLIFWWLVSCVCILTHSLWWYDVSSKPVLKYTRDMFPWNMLSTWKGCPSIVLSSWFWSSFSFLNTYNAYMFSNQEWGVGWSCHIASCCRFGIDCPYLNHLCLLSLCVGYQNLLQLRHGYFALTVWCENSCSNFIQRYLLHRDSPPRPKVKKRLNFVFLNLCYIFLSKVTCLVGRVSY